MSYQRVRATLSLCFLLLLPISAVIAVTPPHTHAQAPSARDRVRRAIARFEAALQTTDPDLRRRELEAALAELDEANRLESETLIEWNLARVEQELGRPVRALEHVERFLAGAPAGHARRVEAEALAAVLRTRVASVWVETQVASARVLIDGEVRGTTPLAAAIRVPAGEVMVEVSAPGYQTGARRIRVAGETETHVRVELELEATALGEVRIRSALLDVQITIDDQVRGTTPLEGTAALTPGTHALIAERAGYRRLRRTLAVELGAEQTVDVVLEPDPDARLGTLALRLPEARAELTIDGREVDLDAPIRLPEGRHALALDVEERQDWDGAITLRPGETSTETPALRWSDEAFAHRHDSARGQRMIGGVVIGAGGAALAAGVTLVLYGALVAVPRYDGFAAVIARCEFDTSSPECSPFNRAELDGNFAQASFAVDIGYGLGIPLLVASAIAIPIGVWLFADAPDDDAIRSAAHASLRVGPARLELVGTF